MKRHVLTLGFRPDCDLQLESPLQSLMQDKKKKQNHHFSHACQKIIVQLECATAPYISLMWNLIF